MRSVNRKESERRERFVEQQRASGLSVVEFCEKRGVHPRAFYLWRAKLEGRQKPMFQEVTLEPDIDLGATTFELRLGSCLLSFPSLPDPQWLANVIAACDSFDKERSC